MGNAKIVKTGDCIRVTLNDESTKFGRSTDLISAHHVDRAYPKENVVEVSLTDSQQVTWTHDAAYSGQVAVIIESIDAGDGAGEVTTNTQEILINQIDKMMQ